MIKDTGITKKSGNSRKLQLNHKPYHNWKVIAIAIYITFLIVSTIPFMADKVFETQLEDTYDYNLKYRTDGKLTHYYVERFNKSNIGQIDLVYNSKLNSISVTAMNIDVLHIDCRSMYEDECKNVFGFDPSENSNYYKWYFIEKNHLSVVINSNNKISDLSFIDTPIPSKVFVNGINWIEGKQYNYTNSYSTVLSNVPLGMTQVDIYFKSDSDNGPQARINVDKEIVNINKLVHFDANDSFDLDGKIISYIWDFGDGTTSGGVINAHSYTDPGVFGVILTVRDDDSLIDQDYLNITVVQGFNHPIINGIVPDQIKLEDSTPWELDLSDYGIDLESNFGDLRWYLTGENTSLYHTVGENSTDQKLIFLPKPNAFGNDLVTLWLEDMDGYTTNQLLWINITPVNDKPVIDNLPDLVVHYDLPYHFVITHYIDDIETPREDLIITAYDKFEDKYIHVNGQMIEFLYPKELMNNLILVTIEVSDGEDESSQIITVSVTNNGPPVLIKKLPDILLEEGTSRENIFDLDDYFSDPEDDELYYTYGRSNVVIIINSNNTVDLISLDEWTGEETVIFRARDSLGGFIEDIIRITVLPVNDPPIITNVPDLMVHYDMDYYFDLSFYVSDNDNELGDLTVITTDLEHIRINPDNNLGLILNYPKSMLGTTIKVVIIVFDGISEASKVIQVTIIEEYPPELIMKLPDVSFNEDESLIGLFDLDEYFLDLDNDSLYYTSGNKMINISINDENRVSFYAPNDWYGEELVTFRAIDPIGALVEDSLLVNVLPVNDPPVLRVLPKISVPDRDTVNFDLGPYIFDVDNNISEIIIEVDNENVLIKGTNMILFGSNKLPKKLYIYVSDGELSTTGILEIKLISKSKSDDYLVSFVIAFFVILISIILLAVFLVLRHRYIKSQQFEIEEIFLIHNSGKLLNHVYCKSHSNFDDEIFSSMFTAIQEFIEDTFTRGPDNLEIESVSDIETSVKTDKPMKLNEFKAGDNQVIIEHGKFVFMAVVYSGLGVGALHEAIKNCIKDIEMKYGEVLDYWDGDVKDISGIKIYLEKLMPESEKIVSDTQKNILKDTHKVRKRIKVKSKFKKRPLKTIKF